MPILEQAFPRPSSVRSLLCAVVGSVFVATAVQAAPITTLSAATDHPMSAVNVFGSTATPESGLTFTSTYDASVYGYTGGYGLSENGYWTGATGPYIGLNTSDGYMTITFDEAVSSFLAFVNYAPGWATPYVAAYDASGSLIESMDLSFSTPYEADAGETLGFSEGANSIKSVRFGNGYIVAANLATGQAVPLPNTALLMALGFGALALALRRRGTRGSMPAAAAAALVG